MVETYSVTITDEAWDDVYDIVAYLRKNVRACLKIFKLIINGLWFWRCIKEGVYRDK